MYQKNIIFLSLLAVCLFTATFAYSQEIRVAVGLSIPPYAIQERNSGKELDIVSAALARAGHTIKPVYLPLGRIPLAIQRGEVDAAMTMTKDSGLTNVCFSDSHISYQNMVISLHKNHFNIDKVSDMAGHSIAAFQNARLYLGEDFKKMANANSRYFEYAQQVLQNMMLYSGRIDLVIADRYIFDYYNNEAQKRGANIKQIVDYHILFPETANHVVFREQSLCDAFNKALYEIRQDGNYQEIINRY